MDAKKAGKYGFSVVHQANGARLAVDGKTLFQTDARDRSPQGIVELTAGIHSVEFSVLCCVGSSDPLFTAKPLAPGAADSAALAPEGLLLPKER